ncbi:sortase [Candidatus Saccharibacteria bacterium]|nr:sortase [Candidatus Saccharibacteria bacterium]
MNSEDGGQFHNNLQRRAAAQIARNKVLAAYVDAAEKSATEAEQAAAARDELEHELAEADRMDTIAVPSTDHMKDQPMDTTINSESWRKYHSAWQDYYQKYYSDYYSKAAREYIAKERLKDAREQAEDEDLVYAVARAGDRGTASTGLTLSQKSGGGIYSGGDTPDARSADTTGAILRRKVRRRASDNAKKTRKLRKFTPVFAGLAVAATILFLQYNRLIFAPLMAYVSPGNAPASEIDALDPTITQTISSEPRLIIPKLNIDVPIRFDVPLADVMDAMNDGVAHYRIRGASSYPGEAGNFIITGHSAGDVYSANPYKYIFSGLERLEDGDLIYVNYNSVRYTYSVNKKQVIEPTNVAALVVQTDKPIITLVTCTPLGTSRYRLLVTGEQISPIYDEAAEAEKNADTETPVVDEASLEMPSNEPSFFERIWNWMTGN